MGGRVDCLLLVVRKKYLFFVVGYFCLFLSAVFSICLINYLLRDFKTPRKQSFAHIEQEDC